MAFEVQGGKDISSLMKPFIAHIGLDITISIIFFFSAHRIIFFCISMESRL